MIESIDRLHRWRWGLVVLLIFCAAWTTMLAEGSFGNWYAAYLNRRGPFNGWFGCAVPPVVPMGHGLPWLILFDLFQFRPRDLLSPDLLISAAIFLGTLLATLFPICTGNPLIPPRRLRRFMAALSMSYSMHLLAGLLLVVTFGVAFWLMAILGFDDLVKPIGVATAYWAFILALPSAAIVVAVRWSRLSDQQNWYRLTMRRLLWLAGLSSGFLLVPAGLLAAAMVRDGGWRYWRIDAEGFIFFASMQVSVLCWSMICLTAMLFRWPAHRAAVADTEGRYCRQCGYDLTGTRLAGRGECPECGEHVGQPAPIPIAAAA